MNPRPDRRARAGRSGFTLIELTLAITLSLGAAGAIIALLSQQVSFNRMLADYRFIRDEAPQVSSLIGNLLNKADSYRIYPGLDEAKSMDGAVRSEGRALRLRFRSPDGGLTHAIIAFETAADGGAQLNYYYWDGIGAGWPAAPAWTISRRPTLVEFDNTSGVLLITMRGPSDEEITYAGSPD